MGAKPEAVGSDGSGHVAQQTFILESRPLQQCTGPIEKDLRDIERIFLDKIVPALRPSYLERQERYKNTPDAMRSKNEKASMIKEHRTFPSMAASIVRKKTREIRDKFVNIGGNVPTGSTTSIRSSGSNKSKVQQTADTPSQGRHVSGATLGISHSGMLRNSSSGGRVASTHRSHGKTKAHSEVATPISGSPSTRALGGVSPYPLTNPSRVSLTSSENSARGAEVYDVFQAGKATSGVDNLSIQSIPSPQPSGSVPQVHRTPLRSMNSLFKSEVFQVLKQIYEWKDNGFEITEIGSIIKERSLEANADQLVADFRLEREDAELLEYVMARTENDMAVENVYSQEFGRAVQVAAHLWGWEQREKYLLSGLNGDKNLTEDTIRKIMRVSFARARFLLQALKRNNTSG